MIGRKNTPLNERGSLLIQVVVVLVLFALLGAAMVAIFAGSIHSTGTPNKARRAEYLRESAVRYARSELQNAANISSTIVTLNNIANYTVSDAGTFNVNVLGLWFADPSDGNDQSIAAGGTLRLNVPRGRLTDDFSLPGGASVVRAGVFTIKNPSLTDRQTARVRSYSKLDDYRLSLVLDDNFSLTDREQAYLAVQPPGGIGSQTVLEGQTLYVAPDAWEFFPKKEGTVLITGASDKNYTYEVAVNEPAFGRVALKKMGRPTGTENPFPLSVAQTDYVILSPYYKNLKIDASATYQGQVTKTASSNAYLGVSSPTSDILSNLYKFVDETGKKAEWSFDDTSQLGKDETGAHPATVTGDVTAVSGVVGGAIELAGGHLEVADSPELEMSIGDKVSVAAWVKKNTAQSAMSWVAIVQKSDYSYNLQLEDGNHPVFTIWDGVNRDDPAGQWKSAKARNPDNSQFPLENGVWYYLVGTFDSADPGEVREVYSLNPDTQGEEKSNDHRRCVLEADDLVDFSGEQIRFKFEADPVNTLNIDLAYIGERNGLTYDMKSSPGKVQLTFENGNPNVTIPAGQSKWSDWVNFPTDGTTDLLVSIDFGSPAYVYYTSLSGIGVADALWYDTDGAAQDAAPAGVGTSLWRAAASDVEVANGENVKIYVDGELMGTSAASQIGDATGWKVGIGANLDKGDRELDGSLDEVRIYNRALSAQEVLDYYNFTKPASKD